MYSRCCWKTSWDLNEYKHLPYIEYNWNTAHLTFKNNKSFIVLHLAFQGQRVGGYTLQGQRVGGYTLQEQRVGGYTLQGQRVGGYTPWFENVNWNAIQVLAVILWDVKH